jgi:hypothetical protein
MADYACFMKKIEFFLDAPEHDTETILATYVSQRNLDVLESRPVVQLLLEMVKEDEKCYGKPFERDAEGLLRKLNVLNSPYNLSIPHNARSLGQFITNQKTELAEYFDVNVRKGGGRVRYYTFTLKKGGEKEK